MGCAPVYSKLASFFRVRSLRMFVYGSGILAGFAACGNNQVQAPVASNPYSCKTPQKITSIYRDHVYDLSGYAGGAGDPFNLFDENAYVDPRFGNSLEPNYIPHTNPQPVQQPAIYFPYHKGSRIVADLQAMYTLSEVYVYDRSHSEDSVWIYTGDMHHWKLQVGFTTRSDPGLWGWRRFSVLDSSRFIMVRFSSYETCITEMVWYGCPHGVVPPAPNYARGKAQFSKKMMKDFLGVNYVMENDLHWLTPFHYHRLYNFALDFDNDSLHQQAPPQFNMLHYGNWDPQAGKYHFDIDQIANLNHSVVWYSIRGVSRWMDKLGFTDKDRPVNVPGMDPEDPRSYSRHAAMMWNLAAFFGKTRVDTSRLALVHRPRQSGRGVMTLFENGNEEDATWVGSKYCSPLEYFAQSSADYDGDQGQMGPDCGLINADPSCQLMTSGMIEMDTNRVRTYKFLCNSLRRDSAFVWKGGIQYHHYSTDGQKGLSPEQDSLRWRLTTVREATRRIAPEAECFLGENGYDKNPASRQGAPVLPGVSHQDGQGIFILRSINATAFSGFDAYILFWLRDYGPESDANPYATCGIIGPAEKGGTKAYPAWYYICAFEHRLGDFAPDSIVSEKGDVWVYKYRNRLSSDSVAYFVYCPTRNGTQVHNYRLPVGAAQGDQATQVFFSDGSVWGDQANQPVTKGILTMEVEERPKLVLLKEKR
jgi:hypothetical protein